MRYALESFVVFNYRGFKCAATIRDGGTGYVDDDYCCGYIEILESDYNKLDDELKYRLCDHPDASVTYTGSCFEDEDIGGKVLSLGGEEGYKVLGFDRGHSYSRKDGRDPSDINETIDIIKRGVDNLCENLTNITVVYGSIDELLI